MYIFDNLNIFNVISFLRPPRRNSGTGNLIATINPPVFILHLKLTKGKIYVKKCLFMKYFFAERANRDIS